MAVGSVARLCIPVIEPVVVIVGEPQKWSNCSGRSAEIEAIVRYPCRLIRCPLHGFVPRSTGKVLARGRCPSALICGATIARARAGEPGYSDTYIRFPHPLICIALETASTSRAVGDCWLWLQESGEQPHESIPYICSKRVVSTVTLFEGIDVCPGPRPRRKF